MAHETSPSAARCNSITSPATISSVGDGYSVNVRFIELQKELRFVLSTGVTSLAPSRAPSPDHEDLVEDQGLNVTTADGTAVATPSQQGSLLNFTRLPDGISKLCVINYLKNWMTECAPFLDKFDEKHHFGVQVPILAQHSPALFYAILAFSARQTERKNAVEKSYDSLELYQESIRLLGPSLQAREASVLVTVCILACLELMSGSPRDWKRHLEGCASLFSCFGVTGFSGRLLQAVFWCYARMELCGVIISNSIEATVLPLDRWIPPMPSEYSPSLLAYRERHESFAHHLFRETSWNCPDMHANWAVYLCTKACDLICRRVRHLELGEQDDDKRPFAARWHYLWKELQFWLDHRPSELLPITTTEPSGSQLFPEILYTHWAAISSNQLYHTACLILLDTISLGRPDLTSLSSRVATSSHQQQHSLSLVWHAKRVCGISLTNPHLGNLVNAIQPLYVAGRHLTHPEEHLTIGRLLKKIDRSTGWGALWRLRDLEAVWGYDQGEILFAIKGSN